MFFRNKKTLSGLKLTEFNELPSTNEYCKSEALPGNGIILAHRQTKGHGRMGRNFVSAEGGLYVSFYFEAKEISPEALVPLTGKCAVAVLRALEKVCKITPDIKWTNDLLLHGKKICGILAETVWGGDGRPEKLIIGIGINQNQSPQGFDGELSAIASSIYALTGKKTDKYKLLSALANEISRVYSSLLSRENEGEYLDLYRKHCTTLGKEVHILHPSIVPNEDPRVVFAREPDLFPMAAAVDIDNDFGLILRHGDGSTEVLRSGEVSIR
ncbi:MAG: biotin--[acetyl-CoA-carboxylase] ligase [Ruminococcaceae bacterium]|nr:biotin--[acetyl-CoA-carboxylase] ligase [Oscillospiraceae bacterium]